MPDRPHNLRVGRVLVTVNAVLLYGAGYLGATHLLPPVVAALVAGGFIFSLQHALSGAYWRGVAQVHHERVEEILSGQVDAFLESLDDE